MCFPTLSFLLLPYTLISLIFLLSTFRETMIPRLVSLLGFASLAISATSIDTSAERRSSTSYPVYVSRNGTAEGFGFSHAANDEYTATIYVNSVPYQVCSFNQYHACLPSLIM